VKLFVSTLFLVLAAIIGLGASAHAKPRHHHRHRVVVKHEAPFVYDEQRGYDRCASDDPNGPCTGRQFIVKNPLPKPVVVTVGCPYDRRLDQEDVIEAHNHANFDVGTGEGSLSPGSCGLLEWHVIK
jgi:hypothetical protein